MKELWAETMKLLFQGAIQWAALATFECPWTVPTTQWYWTGMTICAFYLFERLNIFSLSKGKGNLFDEEISIPIWGGHWSYMCA